MKPVTDLLYTDTGYRELQMWTGRIERNWAFQEAELRIDWTTFVLRRMILGKLEEN